jgi:transaldolase
MYIEGLAGRDTVNSMPPETLESFRDHGKATPALTKDTAEAEEVIEKLLAMEINLRSIGMDLTEQGVEKFEKSYDDLLRTLDGKRENLLKKTAA